jgi:SNF2 family DNA or RNA helicase
MNLLPDQQSAVEKLNCLKVGALFMRPGTGKTLTAVTLINSTEVPEVIWFTPFRTKDNLRAELAKSGLVKNCQVIGIETLSSSDREYLRLFNYVQTHDCFVVVDESLKIKNNTAKRTQRIIEIGKYAKYKLVLNGTPISKNMLDIWAQMEFLSPKILKMDFAEFKNTFCKWSKVTKWVSGRQVSKEVIHEFTNIDYLYSVIAPYVYESDLFIQVKKEYNQINYKISDEEMEQYQHIKTHYLDNETLQFLNNNIFIEMTQKMQHLYCISENKLEKLDELMAKLDQSKVLIYCKYIVSRETLQKKYPLVSVMSYGMHSFGLNLQDKHITIYFDKTFDYAQRLQSEQRTYRTGQNHDCIYYDMNSNTGLDILVNDNIQKKQSMDEYFRAVKIEEIINTI